MKHSVVALSASGESLGEVQIQSPGGWYVWEICDLSQARKTAGALNAELERYSAVTIPLRVDAYGKVAVRTVTGGFEVVSEQEKGDESK